MVRTITAGMLSLAFLFTMVPVAAHAQTTSAEIQAKLDAIKALQAQMQALQTQMKAAQAQQMTAMADLSAMLRQGSSGDQVLILQALLAADAAIYPEGLVTGFYGPATERAVKRFQKEHDLEQVGFIGPKTLKRLREYLKEHPMAFGTSATSTANRLHDEDDNDNDRKGKRPCAIVPPGHLIAPGWLRKNGENKEVLRPCQVLPPGIWDKLNGSTTPPVTDTTAPVISNVNVGSIGSTTATVSWNTNENATGKVFYSPASPFVIGSASVVNLSSLTTAHSFTLSGLTASTTYTYVVGSSDGSNNTATSNQATFTTTN